MTRKISVQHLIVAPLLTVLVFVVCYFIQSEGFEAFSFFRGLFSNVCFGLIFSLLILLIPKKLAVVPSLFLIVFLVFNNTHILVNGSNLNVEFYHFLFKSSFRESLFNLSYAETFLYVFTAWLVALSSSRIFSNIDLKTIYWVPAALFCIVIDFWIPTDVSFNHWPQQNFLVSNVNNWRATSFFKNQNVTAEESFFVHDIKGEKVLSGTIKTRPNIVVLILEGFSQSYVELGLAPEIKKIQAEGVTVHNFITNQLQTNRGLYALFCADYPNMVTYEAKPDFLASNLIQKFCLPHALKRLGYENYFLQSAFLSFMRKDLFAKNAGFNFAVGADSFKEEQVISTWGIPDDLLIESVYKILVEKNDSNHPKFISALTTGTHHPYVTPASRGDLPSAIQFTDMAVGRFYQELKKKNLLKDTLLIITSDEAKTLSPKFPDIYSNWGLMTMVGAGLKKESIDQVFSQVDLSNSVLDFLGKALEFKMPGRSLLRTYKTPRTVFMGNIYSKRISMTIGQKSYLVCDYFLNCRVKSGEKGLFSSQYEKRSATELEIETIKNFVNQNDLTFSKINRSILFQEPNITIAKGKAYGVLEEFKTTSAVNQHLKYEVEKKDSNPIQLEYSYYKCGDPQTAQSGTRMMAGHSDSFAVSVPPYLINENLCHSFYILNKSKKDVVISRVVFSK